MKSVKNHIKAMIFDMDGTIIRSEHLYEEATKKVLHDRGFSTFTPSQLTALEGLSGCGLHHGTKTIKEVFNLSDSVDTLIKDLKNHVHHSFDDTLEFIEGFKHFHTKLQEHGIASGLATNSDRASLNIISRVLKLDEIFGTHIYSADDVGIAKPSPKLFLHTSDMLKVKPEECLVFEDSIFGFKAAHAAGMRCIGIKNGVNHDIIDDLTHGGLETYHDAEEMLYKILAL